ncbi:DMP19 family protein [Pseudoteredinibacter isoporae]|uniref:DMP19 family protein n=1 Tax=Pseudoteredinibacter isoporae TaxID=570281 RepID=UPI003108568C
MEEGGIFLEQYSGQSLKELIELQSTHRIDSLVLAIESALDSRKEADESMTEAELSILAVEAFEREVGNGGFIQFFINSSVEYTPILVDALKAISCHKLANIAQQSIDALGVNPSDIDAVEDKANSEDDALEEILAELDDAYYETDEAPAYALFDYIKHHRDQIRLTA